MSRGLSSGSLSLLFFVTLATKNLVGINRTLDITDLASLPASPPPHLKLFA